MTQPPKWFRRICRVLLCLIGIPVLTAMWIVVTIIFMCFAPTDAWSLITSYPRVIREAWTGELE